MSVTGITQTRDVLYSFSDNAKRIGDLSNEYEKALAKVDRENKYDSRAEVGENAEIYDNASATMLNCASYKSVAVATQVKLFSQQEALAKIDTVMTDFYTSCHQNNSAVGSNADKADKALDSIQQILRSKNTEGKYIFGGNDPYTDPVSVINQSGQRVAVDLTLQSNIKNGLVAENNYSTSSENTTTVNASYDSKIKPNLLYASMDAIVQTIGFLNIFKTGVVVAAPNVVGVTLEDIGAKQTAQKDILGLAAFQINSEIKRLQSASEVNAKDYVNAVTSLSPFKTNVLEATERAQTLMQSLMTAATTSAAAARASEKMQQIMS